MNKIKTLIMAVLVVGLVAFAVGCSDTTSNSSDDSTTTTNSSSSTSDDSDSSSSSSDKVTSADTRGIPVYPGTEAIGSLNADVDIMNMSVDKPVSVVEAWYQENLKKSEWTVVDSITTEGIGTSFELQKGSSKATLMVATENSKTNTTTLISITFE